MRFVTLAFFAAWLLTAAPAGAVDLCSTFTESTMHHAGVSPVATWRTDYPSRLSATPAPWSGISFADEPERYMKAVLDEVRPYFVRKDKTLVGAGDGPWWLSLWMDYDKLGREPLMGLTKELAPRTRQLSRTSESGSQVWAVNFYNEPGAVALHQVFADPCSPTIPKELLFAEGTVAIKFLFTDANLGKSAGQVGYLDGAPKYEAYIDPEGTYWPAETKARGKRDVNMLQLDLAVRDPNATKTGWVFGTFVWMGPSKGDGLYDNLVPAVLMWANDADVFDDKIKESWINPAVVAEFSGWDERPFLGFNGRANGPADNLNSSCLSCHAAARLPLAKDGIARPGKFPVNLKNQKEVEDHVKLWFQDIQPGELFQPSNPPAVAAVDYSLQIRAAIERMCFACKDGAMQGATPEICRTTHYFDGAICIKKMKPEVLMSQKLREQNLPRE
ncbi:hypothetical protein NKH52_17750 [Mesorhizobium sp. M1066]|uniref:hypothetical protein n=1 Tax=unclassified Mesorhizobium TaxID=325217 RepID=UPI00333BF870